MRAKWTLPVLKNFCLAWESNSNSPASHAPSRSRECNVNRQAKWKVLLRFPLAFSSYYQNWLKNHVLKLNFFFSKENEKQWHNIYQGKRETRKYTINYGEQCRTRRTRAAAATASTTTTTTAPSVEWSKIG